MPSISNLFRRGGLKWQPDAEATTAPDDALLRADNLVPDSTGALVLRRGSEVVYSGLGNDVHTLYTAELVDGNTYRVAGVDNAILVNGVNQQGALGGSGDFAIGDDATQVFMARGNVKKKWDGTSLYDWPIKRPVDAPTLTAVAQVTEEIAAFDGEDSPAVTVTEGTGTVGAATDQSGSANEATYVTPAVASGRAVLQRLWTTDQDFFDVASVAGSETDLITFYIKMDEPRNVEEVKVVFGITDSSTNPFTERFVFKFNIKDSLEIPLKDAESEGYAAYEAAVLAGVSGVKPWDVTGIQTPEQVKKTLAAVGKKPSPKSTVPPEGTWGQLTVSRGQFTRIGSTPSRGWDTVRGFRIVYTTLKGKTDGITVADAIVIGGGDRCLTGTYRCVIQAVRQVEDTAGNIRYYEKSPPSPQSDPINLNHQSLKITVSGTTRQKLDLAQTDQLWVYLFGGWLDAYYRFAVVPASPQQGMTIDELTAPAGDDFDTTKKRMRIPSWGFTYCQTGTGTFTLDSLTSVGTTATATTPSAHGYTSGQSVWIYGCDQSEYNGIYVITVTGADTFTYTFAGSLTSPAEGTIVAHNETPLGDGLPDLTASSDVNITLRTSELDALTANQRLEPYLIAPPDNIVGIAGPWNSRLFVLTSEGYVYPSLQTSPSSFNSLQVIDLTKYGDPLWIAKTGAGVYVGCERDVIYLAGSGDNSEDLAQIDLYGQPLNIGNPPIDKMHWVEGNSIVYRSTDGLMILTGTTSEPLPTAGTSLLWRGQNRHGVQALNVSTGRFRCAVDNFMLYMLAPEGDDESGNVIYRYSFPSAQWSRLVFGQVDEFLSIYNEPDGGLIAGDNTGRLWLLESGQQDDGNDPTVYVLSPISDGGQPLAAKDAFDVQLHTYTGSDTLTLSLFKDGNSTATSTYSVSTAQPDIWRAQADDFGVFVKAQISLAGTASDFSLSAHNISYRERPQRSMTFDTGYFMAAEPGDLLWLQEIELDAIVNTATFTVCVYVNDVLKWTSDAQTATTGKRMVYRIPVPRGTKGERVRLVFKGSDSTGTGLTGIDAYSVRVRTDGSGNQDGSRTYQRVWPSGEAA